MKAYRNDGNLVIEISENVLVNGVHLIPELPSFTVTDREVFLDFCAEQIIGFGDGGDFNACSKLTTLIDDLVEHATESAAGIEQGAAGCHKPKKEYIVPIVDCEYSSKTDGCCTHNKNITPECHVACCPRLSKEIKKDL